MLNLDELQVPAFCISSKTNEVTANKKYKQLELALQEKIQLNYYKKNFVFNFQEKNYQIIELSVNVFIIIQDLVESYQTIREATKHSMALQMRILNELGEGVFIEDKTGKIIFANPSAEKVLDLVSYEIVGQSFLSFIYPEEEKIRIQRLLQKLSVEINENKSVRFETQIKNKNSDVIYLLVYYSVMLTNKSIEGALITIYDISDMKKLTKEIEERSNELLQAEKLTSIGLLASGISHELNNPLSFIISNTSALEDYVKSILDYLREREQLVEQTITNESNTQENRTNLITNDPKGSEIELIKKEIIDILNANQRGLNRLSDVISDLRKFSHANKEDSEKKEVINVTEPINLALNLLSYELKSINVQLEVDKQKEKYLILGNAKLYQVFLNIIYNAGQSITENQKNKGIIIIKIYEENHKVIIQISDNGLGIAEKSIPRIFDPFYTTKPSGIGTGLGLSISQRIINDLGGYIVAESGTILDGATFTLYFPVYEETLS